MNSASDALVCARHTEILGTTLPIRRVAGSLECLEASSSPARGSEMSKLLSTVRSELKARMRARDDNILRMVKAQESAAQTFASQSMRNILELTAIAECVASSLSLCLQEACRTTRARSEETRQLKSMLEQERARHADMEGMLLARVQAAEEEVALALRERDHVEATMHAHQNTAIVCQIQMQNEIEHLRSHCLVLQEMYVGAKWEVEQAATCCNTAVTRCDRSNIVQGGCCVLNAGADSAESRQAKNVPEYQAMMSAKAKEKASWLDDQETAQVGEALEHSNPHAPKQGPSEEGSRPELDSRPHTSHEHEAGSRASHQALVCYSAGPKVSESLSVRGSENLGQAESSGAGSGHANTVLTKMGHGGSLDEHAAMSTRLGGPLKQRCCVSGPDAALVQDAQVPATKPQNSILRRLSPGCRGTPTPQSARPKAEPVQARLARPPEERKRLAAGLARDR